MAAAPGRGQLETQPVLAHGLGHEAPAQAGAFPQFRSLDGDGGSGHVLPFAVGAVGLLQGQGQRGGLFFGEAPGHGNAQRHGFHAAGQTQGREGHGLAGAFGGEGAFEKDAMTVDDGHEDSLFPEKCMGDRMTVVRTGRRRRKAFPRARGSTGEGPACPGGAIPRGIVPGAGIPAAAGAAGQPFPRSCAPRWTPRPRRWHRTGARGGRAARARPWHRRIRRSAAAPARRRSSGVPAR